MCVHSTRVWDIDDPKVVFWWSRNWDKMRELIIKGPMRLLDVQWTKEQSIQQTSLRWPNVVIEVIVFGEALFLLRPLPRSFFSSTGSPLERSSCHLLILPLTTQSHHLNNSSVISNPLSRLINSPATAAEDQWIISRVQGTKQSRNPRAVPTTMSRDLIFRTREWSLFWTIWWRDYRHSGEPNSLGQACWWRVIDLSTKSSPQSRGGDDRLTGSDRFELIKVE